MYKFLLTFVNNQAITLIEKTKSYENFKQKNKSSYKLITMTIKQLKKELGLSQKDISEFYNMSYGSFANSTAKTRYENALCKFYELIKKREEERRKEKEQCTIPVVGRSCFDCKRMASMQPDIVCHIWCDKKDRDFTFGGENTEACELFEED